MARRTFHFRLTDVAGLSTIAIAVATAMFVNIARAQPDVVVSPPSTTIKDVARLKGEGRTVLQGFGLVIGLPGTGDSGDSLAVARPLARLLETQGNPVGSFEELADSKSIALVEITCTINGASAYTDDRFDVVVSALNNPDSLAGGELFISPLRGPLPGQGVFAFASGPLVVDGANSARARVRGGAVLVRDIQMPTVAANGTITFVIQPQFAGWSTAQLLANTINQDRLGLDTDAPELARANDERTVRVRIPSDELRDPASFIASIQNIRFDPMLLSLPARVVINEREGVIVVTGDVLIRPTVISHGDLVVTTVTPPSQPSPQNPTIEQSTWTTLGKPRRDRDAARLQDLMSAFKRLAVPVKDQIAIIVELHRSGSLHADLVIN